MLGCTRTSQKLRSASKLESDVLPLSCIRPIQVPDAIQVRLATPADVPAIVAVVNAAFAIETFIEGERTDQAQILEMMRKGNFLVAEDSSGRLSASVYVEIRGQAAYFGMLAVAPSCQGRGLGRIMVSAAEESGIGNGCKRMGIAVLSLRPELMPFYRKLGYLESGTEVFHPSRPLKAGAQCFCISMSKALT
jgi:ribosomal protein S18 acetylase RimI-like enzyme